MSDLKTAEPIVKDIDLPVFDGDVFGDALERVTGSKLIHNNDVRLLIDATENYPAWLEAIESAETRILFESYIIHNDKQGELFADRLIAKAKEGVEVKVIYDWMGALGNSPGRYWRRLREGGVDVRCYNPPNLLDPLGLFSRDHRKTIVVDGRIAFVSGLCVGEMWVGDPGNGTPPWRDTGLQLTGPAVAEVEAAFADVWATMGPPIGLTKKGVASASGDGKVAVRIVKSSPGASYIYRLDQMLAITARETMWISDAYFVGIPSYLQTLKDASNDGVDVRILVPQSTDIGLIRDTTRSTYRPLLEAGIRVFEWNGPMMHAKTAVFDGKYARVGSTNLNIASWFGNYELDVLVEDEDFGRQMEDMFLRDMEGSTEIVLSEASVGKRSSRRPKRFRRSGGGSVSRATAGALNAASSIGSALSRKSLLGAAEARIMAIAAAVLIAFAILLILFPRAASIPIIILLLILAIPALINSIQTYRKHG